MKESGRRRQGVSASGRVATGNVGRGIGTNLATLASGDILINLNL